MSTELPFLVPEPEADYHAARKDHLTSHSLADFRRCPLLYHLKQTGKIVDEDRLAYTMGRAAHTLILEGPEIYADRYVVGGPVNPKTGKCYGSDTKKYAAWAAEQGKPTVTDEEDALARRLSASVHGHPAVGDLLGGGVIEGVVRVEYNGIECQGRLDYFDTEYGLVDLKTCADLDKFEWDFKRYGYAFQVAFYDALISRAGDLSLGVHIIAVEKQEPYRVGVWELTSDLLDWACAENENAMIALKECRESGKWPTGYEEVRTFGYGE